MLRLLFKVKECDALDKKYSSRDWNREKRAFNRSDRCTSATLCVAEVGCGSVASFGSFWLKAEEGFLFLSQNNSKLPENDLIVYTLTCRYRSACVSMFDSTNAH